MWRPSRSPALLTVAAALVVVFLVLPPLASGHRVCAGSSASAQGSARLQQRVLRASELPGFKVDGQLEVARSAQAWACVKESGNYKDAAALQARGFVVGAREHLYRPRAGVYSADANSAVIEFKTPRGAAAQLAETIRGMGSDKQFAVPGIPGARAAATSAVDFDGYFIVFADGPFEYFVGVRYLPNAAHPPTRASVIAVAQALYRRVHRA
jgi:hypothetical protein